MIKREHAMLVCLIVRNVRTEILVIYVFPHTCGMGLLVRKVVQQDIGKIIHQEGVSHVLRVVRLAQHCLIVLFVSKDSFCLMESAMISVQKDIGVILKLKNAHLVWIIAKYARITLRVTFVIIHSGMVLIVLRIALLEQSNRSLQ